jgi:hypothetical protein
MDATRCIIPQSNGYAERVGGGGGYILAPSVRFFDADPPLLAAFADEARRCAH